MRSPTRLWHETGPRGFIAINLLIGGNVLTALAHPVLLAELTIAAGTAAAGRPPIFFDDPLTRLHILTIVAGYAVTCIVGAAGLIRRGMHGSLWVLALTPLYWIALSIAAWRALYQLIVNPYHWEKTEHGLARSSFFNTPSADAPPPLLVAQTARQYQR